MQPTPYRDRDHASGSTNADQQERHPLRDEWNDDDGDAAEKPEPFDPWRGSVMVYEEEVTQATRDGYSVRAVDLIAGVSNGTLHLRSANHPGRYGPGTHKVLLLSPRTWINDRMKNYLRRAGANFRNIQLHPCTYPSNGSSRRIVLPDDCDRLRQDIIAFGAELVMIDPLNVFIEGDDERAITSVRHQLLFIAAETDVAIVGTYRVETANTRRGATGTAGSLSTAAQRGNGTERGNDAHVDSRSSRAVARERMRAAMAFLSKVLLEGPRVGKEIERLGELQGFTPRTLRTARERLGVEISRERVQYGRWLWALPLGSNRH